LSGKRTWKNGKKRVQETEACLKDSRRRLRGLELVEKGFRQTGYLSLK
jgi:hypothetical protein